MSNIRPGVQDQSGKDSTYWVALKKVKERFWITKTFSVILHIYKSSFITTAFLYHVCLSLRHNEHFGTYFSRISVDLNIYL